MKNKIIKTLILAQLLSFASPFAFALEDAQDSNGQLQELQKKRRTGRMVQYALESSIMGALASEPFIWHGVKMWENRIPYRKALLEEAKDLQAIRIQNLIKNGEYTVKDAGIAEHWIDKAQASLTQAERKTHLYRTLYKKVLPRTYIGLAVGTLITLGFNIITDNKIQKITKSDSKEISTSRAVKGEEPEVKATDYPDATNYALKAL